MYELPRPDRSFEKEQAAMFIPAGLHAERRCLQKSMRAQQEKMASLAFSDTL
jgi:hypothetical protein